MAPDLNTRRRWTWWLWRGIALVLFATFVWTWAFTAVQRQDKYVRTTLILLAGGMVFLLWTVLSSGWRARTRWGVILGTVFAGCFCVLTLRIRGVDGDLLPIIRWRWSEPIPMAQINPPPASAPVSVALTNRFPQFLGPNRDATLPGPQLAVDWKSTPPTELWRHAVGAAWSGFAIDGPRAITQEQRGEDELVVCYDTLTGTRLWEHADKARYNTVIAGDGPRATPTIFGDSVFTMGGSGVLNCLDLATGQSRWHHDTLKEFAAPLPEWGVACSPLVTERAVFVTVGGRHGMVAFDRATGGKLWGAGDDKPHWCSPVRATLAGVAQIVVFSESVSSYDEQTGKVLWQHPWPSPFPHVSTPLILGTNRVLFSQGYGGGGELLEITPAKVRWRANRVWKSIRLKSKFASLIQRDGHVYGLDDGALVCLDLADGALKWKGDRYGHGQMLLVGDLLLIMAESGDIVLAEPNPAEFRERARHKVFSAKTWNPPALAGALLLVRNDREAACFRLPLAR